MRIILLLALMPAAVFAQEPAKRWKDTGEFSFTNANGNTKATTLGLNNLFSYQWGRTGLELTAGALSARSNGLVTAEQYNAAEKATWKWTDRDYFYERLGWEKNRFAGIRHRWDGSVGLGREVFKTPKDLLAAELGIGYTTENRTLPPDEDFVSGRAHAKYTRALSATASFSQDAEYLSNFKDGAAYRLATQTALTASMTTHHSMKLSFLWKRVNRPPAGFIKDDTLAAAALIVNY